ncbi:ribosome biogenesis factor YjgA [Melaminivora sp.]|uniref:ribosome biogenesis factor YjgA n=1 Tax=Melaminivora sp. TaxID=1933032 RepID=UPI0028AB0714|nr:ribosome biogenesis factor YjgA [Melaminivora sp.]
MPRKPKKGYFVRGQFVAEGSELDLELKAELKGTTGATKTELKRESEALQSLGAELLNLRGDLLMRLELPDKLHEALEEVQRITNFEGRRRQMQYVGKLMRTLDAERIAAIHAALQEQRSGSAQEKLLLHQAEHWREQLAAHDPCLQDWLVQFPRTDVQQLRALIRQVRKEAAAETAAPAEDGQAARKGRAWRELFQFIRAHMTEAAVYGAEEQRSRDA